MIGWYLLLTFLVVGVGIGLYVGWNYSNRVISDFSDLIVFLLHGMVSGIIFLMIGLLICCSVEPYADFMTRSDEDDQKVAALLLLTNLEGIEISFRDTVPKIYFEVKYNGEIIAPMAKRRETFRVYSELLAKKRYEANLGAENKLDAIIKSHLGK